MKQSPFFKQADLMLRLLPPITKEPDFALHGGTAINFFVRDMPRLSVDIDLTYLPLEPRKEALANIALKLHGLSKRIRNAFPGVRIEEKNDGAQGVSKLLVNYKNCLVKIEPNLVMRGSVFSVEERALVMKAEATFEKFVSVKTLSLEALYGGKICAALDRQHPRDFFDIKLLFENEGYTENIRRAFLVCLISGNRPLNELLNPKLKDFEKTFESEFSGMALAPVTYEELKRAREKLINAVTKGFTQKERRFLLSFKQGNPAWDLLGIEGVDKLPAVQWKLENLTKMDPKKHSQSLSELKAVLGCE